MTAASVAPQPAEQRPNLRPEIDSPPAAKTADAHRYARLRGAVTDDYLSGAVAGWPQIAAVIDAHDRGVAAGVARGASEVILALRNEELSAAVRVREDNFVRRYSQV